MNPASKSIRKTWSRARRFALRLVNDRRGVAAIEFAMILPIMLVLFLGTVEFSSVVAVNRKVSLIARTLSDLTSQSPGSVADNDIINFFMASNAIMTPYPSATAVGTLCELYVDPVTLKAKVEWNKSATFNSSGGVVLGTGLATNCPIAIPSQLVVAGTYLIFSKVTYPYKPAASFSGAIPTFSLSDSSYTRPRQSQCIIYPTPSPGTTVPCPG
jgi:Flp pilus assembly protein TadG